MAEDFPLNISAQLREHLRALRKRQGLTQAQLGEMIGVSQARVAEIEANPGVVNLDQLLQVLASLGASLRLHLDGAAVPASSLLATGVSEPPAPTYARTAPGKKRGSW
jgi:HTH-type transcriptional regulator/antitoxin HipB